MYLQPINPLHQYFTVLSYFTAMPQVESKTQYCCKLM